MQNANRPMKNAQCKMHNTHRTLENAQSGNCTLCRFAIVCKATKPLLSISNHAFLWWCPILQKVTKPFCGSSIVCNCQCAIVCNCAQSNKTFIVDLQERECLRLPFKWATWRNRKLSFASSTEKEKKQFADLCFFLHLVWEIFVQSKQKKNIKYLFVHLLSEPSLTKKSFAKKEKSGRW